MFNCAMKQKCNEQIKKYESDLICNAEHLMGSFCSKFLWKEIDESMLQALKTNAKNQKQKRP